jgi:hypothetical protein
MTICASSGYRIFRRSAARHVVLCDIPASRHASGADLGCAINASIWRSNVTICSALNHFFGMTKLISQAIFSLRLVQKSQVRSTNDVIARAHRSPKVANYTAESQWRDEPAIVTKPENFSLRQSKEWSHSKTRTDFPGERGQLGEQATADRLSAQGRRFSAFIPAQHQVDGIEAQPSPRWICAESGGRF